MKATPAEPPQAQELDRRWLWVLLALLLALGMFVRLYRLGGEDLWGDEILFLRMCHPGLTASEVIRVHLQSFNYIGHLPATAVLTNLGMQLQGLHAQADITPLTARLPSALLGILSLLAVSGWVWRLTRSATGTVLAMLLATFSFLHIWHSREAYYYAGQVLFAVLTLWGWTELTRADGCKKIWVWLCYVVCLLLLAFSHPAGVALLAPLSLASAILAVRQRAVWCRHALLAALGLVLCLVLCWIMLDKAQTSAPWTSTYRFPVWIVIPDLLEQLGFGPGPVRLVFFAGALLGGSVWMVRRRYPLGPTLLMLLPAIFLAIHLGGSSMTYSPRYFLLLWPFFILIVATGLAGLVTQLPLRWRATGLVALVVLAAANVAPGLGLLFQQQSRSECFGALLHRMEEKLDTGTVCVWDGGHALRFLPGFHVAQRPFTYGALPDPSAEAYLKGTIAQQLANLRRAFPAIAYLEWGGLHGSYARQVAGGVGQLEQSNARIAALFPHHEVFDDPIRRAFLESGWLPGIPRLLADREERIADQLAHHLEFFYSTAADRGDLAAPYFDATAWQLLFTTNNLPMLVGAPQAALLLEQSGDPRATRGAHLALSFTAAQPGSLDFLANGTLLQQAQLATAGLGGTFTVPWHGERLVLELRFHGVPGNFNPEYPAYAVTAAAVRADPPPAAP